MPKSPDYPQALSPLASPSLLCTICPLNNLWGWGLQGEGELDLVVERCGGGGCCPRDVEAWGPVQLWALHRKFSLLTACV